MNNTDTAAVQEPFLSDVKLIREQSQEAFGPVVANLFLKTAP